MSRNGRPGRSSSVQNSRSDRGGESCSLSGSHSVDGLNLDLDRDKNSSVNSNKDGRRGEEDNLGFQ
jgi:hypothetical protein